MNELKNSKQVSNEQGITKNLTFGKEFRLAPSLLAADFANLSAELKKIEKYADFLHIDVMDGHFVPNLSFGLPIIEKIRTHTELYFDCHLMVTNPQDYIKPYKKAGVDHISFHLEVEPHAHRCIERIHEEGMTAGVVLNPASPLSLLDEVLSKVELVLLMSVNPGFGGQKCILEVVDKVARLKKIREERGLNFDIQVDGGINLSNYTLFREAGANNLVAGSAVFGTNNPAEALLEMKK